MPRSLKDAGELPVAAGNLGNRRLPVDMIGTEIDQRIPKIRAPDGEADETGHASRDAQAIFADE